MGGGRVGKWGVIDKCASTDSASSRVSLRIVGLLLERNASYDTMQQCSDRVRGKQKLLKGGESKHSSRLQTCSQDVQQPGVRETVYLSSALKTGSGAVPPLRSACDVKQRFLQAQFSGACEEFVLQEVCSSEPGLSLESMTSAYQLLEKDQVPACWHIWLSISRGSVKWFFSYCCQFKIPANTFTASVHSRS